MTQRTVPTDAETEPATRRLRIVPFEDGMLEQVLSLYRVVFGSVAADGYRKRWNWSQKENLYPDQTKRWVLISPDDEVKGFLATIPLPYEIAGERKIAHTTCDFMVHPDARFHGLKLMKQFFAECDNCVSADDVEATIQVTKWLGAEDIGAMPSYARITDMRAFKRGPIKNVPGLLFRPLNPALKVYDRLFVSRAGKSTRVEGVEQFDERFERLFKRGHSPHRASLVRDLPYLNWRYGPGSPQSQREIGIVKGPDGELDGYVVFQRSLKPTTLSRGHIYELHVHSDRKREVAGALIEYAVKQMRRAGVWMVVYRQVPSEFTIPEDLLKSHAFVKGLEHRLLVRLRDDDDDRSGYDLANWCYVYGDSEASHGVS